MLSEIETLRKELVEAKKQMNKLRKFVAFCMESVFYGYDVDVGPAQDKAKKLGLIVKTEPPAEAIEAGDAEPGDTWYRLAWDTPLTEQPAKEKDG